MNTIWEKVIIHNTYFQILLFIHVPTGYTSQYNITVGTTYFGYLVVVPENYHRWK